MDRSERTRGLWFGRGGSFGTIFFASVAMGCCAGVLAPLASAATAAFPFIDHYPSVQMPFLYGSIGFTLIGLVGSYRRQRSAFYIILGLLGALFLLIPFHMALEVKVFNLLIGAGLGGLLAGSWGSLLRQLLRNSQVALYGKGELRSPASRPTGEIAPEVSSPPLLPR